MVFRKKEEGPTSSRTEVLCGVYAPKRKDLRCCLVFPGSGRGDADEFERGGWDYKSAVPASVASASNGNLVHGVKVVCTRVNFRSSTLGHEGRAEQGS